MLSNRSPQYGFIITAFLTYQIDQYNTFGKRHKHAFKHPPTPENEVNEATLLETQSPALQAFLAKYSQPKQQALFKQSIALARAQCYLNLAAVIKELLSKSSFWMSYESEQDVM